MSLFRHSDDIWKARSPEADVRFVLTVEVGETGPIRKREDLDDPFC